jgi:hypothetical protein
MRQAHPSHGGYRQGVFRGFGADDSPIMVNDGLVVLSSAGEQQWQAQWSQSCMDLVPGPSADLVFQLSGADCAKITETHAPLNQIVPSLMQQGYVPLVETTAFLTGAYYSRVIFTKNSETVRQLSGASLGAVQPGVSVFAVATGELNSDGVVLITHSRAIAKGVTPGKAAPVAAAAQAALVGKTSTALIAVGVIGLIFWAFGSKKKRG